MKSATAIRCDDVGDPDELEVATVECYRCDPDNPLAGPREGCPDCRGTGRSPVALVPILREIREARKQPCRRREQSQSSEDDLCLEY